MCSSDLDKVGKTILHELVSEFIKPVVADPQTLSSDRAIAILEQLLNSVLPQLKESEEFKRLASTVLGEEIEQRRDLRARCFEDTPIDSGAAVELGVAQMGEP